eukprot:6958401-Pyramimonas_sp.AAC.1
MVRTLRFVESEPGAPVANKSSASSSPPASVVRAAPGSGSRSTQVQDLNYVAVQHVATEPGGQTSAEATRDRDLRSARQNFVDWQRGAQRRIPCQCVLTPVAQLVATAPGSGSRSTRNQD